MTGRVALILTALVVLSASPALAQQEAADLPLIAHAFRRLGAVPGRRERRKKHRREYADDRNDD